MSVLDRSINKNLNLYAFEDYLNAQVASLPALPDVKQISPCVLRVLGGNPGPVCIPKSNFSVSTDPR
jgi:hypothetical protein